MVAIRQPRRRKAAIASGRNIASRSVSCISTTWTGRRPSVADREPVGEFGGVDDDLDIEVAQRVHVDRLAGGAGAVGEIVEIPVVAVDCDVAVEQAALGEARADGVAGGGLGAAARALVEIGVAEPGPGAAPAREPGRGAVEVGEIGGRRRSGSARGGDQLWLAMTWPART